MIHALGWALICVPLVVIFIVQCATAGVKLTLTAWGFALLLLGLLFLGCHLVNADEFITDGNGQYIGQILPGGYINDSNGTYVGQIRDEGNCTAITDEYGNDKMRIYD